MSRKRSSSVKSFAHEAMGTFFELILPASESEDFAQVSREIFAEIDRIEGLFSRFDPSSEISRINRLNPGSSLKIGVETYEILTLCEQLKFATAGAFDPGILGLMAGAEDKALPSFSQVSASTEQILLVHDEEGFAAVRKEDSRMFAGFDLGGIGKGYALDQCRRIMRDWDIERILLHAGTSTALALGDGPAGDGRGSGWPVGVAGSRKGKGFPEIVRLCNRALSGSGSEVKGAHIIDPKTGRQAEGHLAAWASHEEAAVADALSTAFVVMSTAEVEAFCQAHPDVWGLIVRNDETCLEFNSAVLAL